MAKGARAGLPAGVIQAERGPQVGRRDALQHGDAFGLSTVVAPHTLAGDPAEGVLCPEEVNGLLLPGLRR